MKKIDYALVASIIIALVGWGVSVEKRLADTKEALNMSNRIKNMEDLMLPMLIDWKTHKEVRKWQEENIKKIEKEVGKSDPNKKLPKAAPSIAPVFEEPVPPVVQRKVDNWAKDVFKDESQKAEK